MDLDNYVSEYLRTLNMTKDEFLLYFVLKYNLGADELEIIEQRKLDGNIGWRVQRRSNDA
jgi:hypothetical protein